MNERELFVAALQRPDPAERAAFLDQACDGNTEKRAQLAALLLEHEQLGSFLEAGAVPQGVTLSAPAVSERPGTMIGPYKLLQEIGEGGMGTVYMAEQEQPVRRRVALKIIKPGMDSAQVLARFEAERQALALMDHQNIARVLDVGTTATGRPYFVMELVKGLAITEYCDKNRLTPRERLELFIPVCQAVQHAHQKGIIHRDVKPSNVMVTLYDGKPVPKVIDFGVAKAIEQRLTERTLFTAYGQVVGTLEYMSPEQTALSGLDVDTRSDIYSLGVLAYELLTGSTPLQRQTCRSAAYDEILRLIRELEPPMPSTRLSDSGEGLTTISAQRNTEPAKLTRLMRGELDWIVMKALEKDRGRRYETAGALARDVERYLHDEPVEACPPSAGYRLGKFLRRHKGPMLAAALVLLALVAGIIGTTWGLVWAEWAWQAEVRQRHIAEVKQEEALAEKASALAAAEQERQARIREAEQRQLAEANEKRAVAEKQIAVAVRMFLLRDLLRQADAFEQAYAVRQLGGAFEVEDNPTIRELLDRAAAELTPAKIEARFPGQNEVQAALLRTVGDAYRGVCDFGKAVEFLIRASDLYRDALGADHPDTLITLNGLALTYRAAGKLPQAVELFEQVRDAQVQKLGADHPNTLITLNNLARAYQDAGKVPQAIDLFEQVRDAQVKKLGADHPDTLTTLNNLAGAYLFGGKRLRAVELFEQVRAARVKLFGTDDPATLITLNGLAVAYQMVGKPSQAIELFEQVRDAQVKRLGASHAATLATGANLGVAYRIAGQLPRAIELLEQVRDAEVKKLGTDHPDTLTVQHHLAVAYQAAEKLPQAIALFEQVYDARVKNLGADHPDTLATLGLLAMAYRAVGRVPRAIELLEQVREAQVKKLGADHPDTLITLSNLAIAYKAVGRLPQAIDLFEQVRDAYVQKFGADHPDTLTALNNLAGAYYAARKLPQAIELFEQVRDGRVQKLGADHPSTLTTLGNLAMAYQAAGKLPQAIELLEQVRDAQVKKLGADHLDTLNTLGNLAMAYQVVGKLPQAIELFEQVRDARVQKLGADHPTVLTTLSNLAMAYGAAGKQEQALPLLRQAALGIEKRKFQHEHAGQIVANLVACHERLQQYAEAEAWRRKWLAVVRQQAGDDAPARAGLLAALGANLLKQEKWTESEGVLRECLALCEKRTTTPVPNPPAGPQVFPWQIAHVKSMLGGALAGQKKHDDAEPLLLAGATGLLEHEKTVPPKTKGVIADAIQRLIDLYEATDKKGDAEKWRTRLAERNKAKTPVDP